MSDDVKTLQGNVKSFAVKSRIALFVIQLVSNIILSDHEARVFKKPLTPGNGADKFIAFLFDGYTRWDGQYFLHIAEYGYTYENTTAFFPLFPLTIRIIAHFLSYIIPFSITTHSSLVLSAVLVNNTLFVFSSVILFRLTLLALNNEKMAYLSSMLFCVNPASIFFSAIYSESLYFFITVHSLLLLEKGKFFKGSFLVGLSAITRSNGILNIGYLFYPCLEIWFDKMTIFFKMFQTFILFFFGFSFFAFYQGFCFFSFCQEFDYDHLEVITNHAAENNFILSGKSISIWCNSSIPLAYSYVQKHYWNVGFLNYFQFIQIPNFILALPACAIMVSGTYRFFSVEKTFLWYLGIANRKSSSLPPKCFPYFVHGIALTLFGFFCIHVQVITRLICSSGPIFYWIVALTMSNFDKNAEPGSRRGEMWKRSILLQQYAGEPALIRIYFFAYFLAGTFAFSNFLPWT